MKTQETILAEIESDIHMTVKRRGYAYAGEHAGWLDRAAKRLLKVEDNAVRVELFLKIVRRAFLKAILKKVLPEDTDGLADGLFFPETALPIPDPVSRELVDYVLNDLELDGKYRRERIVVGCLGWLAQLKDENGFDELAKTASMWYTA